MELAAKEKGFDRARAAGAIVVNTKDTQSTSGPSHGSGAPVRKGESGGARTQSRESRGGGAKAVDRTSREACGVGRSDRLIYPWSPEDKKKLAISEGLGNTRSAAAVETKKEHQTKRRYGNTAYERHETLRHGEPVVTGTPSSDPYARTGRGSGDDAPKAPTPKPQPKVSAPKPPPPKLPTHGSVGSKPPARERPSAPNLQEARDADHKRIDKSGMPKTPPDAPIGYAAKSSTAKGGQPRSSWSKAPQPPPQGRNPRAASSHDEPHLSLTPKAVWDVTKGPRPPPWAPKEEFIPPPAPKWSESPDEAWSKGRTPSQPPWVRDPWRYDPPTRGSGDNGDDAETEDSMPGDTMGNLGCTYIHVDDKQKTRTAIKKDLRSLGSQVYLATCVRQEVAENLERDLCIPNNDPHAAHAKDANYNCVRSGSVMVLGREHIITALDKLEDVNTCGGGHLLIVQLTVKHPICGMSCIAVAVWRLHAAEDDESMLHEAEPRKICSRQISWENVRALFQKRLVRFVGGQFGKMGMNFLSQMRASMMMCIAAWDRYSHTDEDTGDTLHLISVGLLLIVGPVRRLFILTEVAQMNALCEGPVIYTRGDGGELGHLMDGEPFMDVDYFAPHKPLQRHHSGGHTDDVRCWVTIDESKQKA